MRALRFILTCAAATLVALPALAQTAAPTASIRDIAVAREGDTVSILVQLSAQPAAAQAHADATGLTLDIDGLTLFVLELTPPAGSLVTRVDAAGARIALSGAAFASATTTVYRDAILVEAVLADPALRASPIPAKATAPATAPIASSATAPLAQPSHTPLPEPVKASSGDTLESRPVAAVKPAAKEAPQPAPSAPKGAALKGAAELAGLNAQRCAVAVGDLESDPWSIDALGNHAICLLDQGKAKEAANRLDQLAAFAPEDWRVSLGRALLAEEKGDASNAETGYRTAAQLAPDDLIRAAIARRLANTAAH